MFPLREGLLPYKEVMVDLNTIFFPNSTEKHPQRNFIELKLLQQLFFLNNETLLGTIYNGIKSHSTINFIPFEEFFVAISVKLNK